MVPLLEARAISKTFGARTAVDRVSLRLSRGDTFALVGPNGAGKTTTLRMLAGLLTPGSGSILLDGRPLSPSSMDALRGMVGLLTEAPGLWDRLTVRRNLLTHARLHALPRPDVAVDAALERFGLRDRGGDLPAQLSKGLRQRVALARTLLHGPPLVLLDEPTSGLDPESARQVRALVQDLRTEQRAVLICTHNLDEVDRLATRVAVLRTTILAEDTPQALRARHFGARVRVDLAEDAGRFGALLRSSGVQDIRTDGRTLSIGLAGHAALDTPDLVRMLVEAGARIDAVTRETPSLEDVYLRILHEGRPA